MKRGVPPTERKARTGEFTPPGVTRDARANSAALAGAAVTSKWSFINSLWFNFRLLVGVEFLGDLGRPVGQDDGRAGPLDRGQRLDNGPVPIDPAMCRSRLDHCVLA